MGKQKLEIDFAPHKNVLKQFKDSGISIPKKHANRIEAVYKSIFVLESSGLLTNAETKAIKDRFIKTVLNLSRG